MLHGRNFTVDTSQLFYKLLHTGYDEDGIVLGIVDLTQTIRGRGGNPLFCFDNRSKSWKPKAPTLAKRAKSRAAGMYVTAVLQERARAALSTGGFHCEDAPREADAVSKWCE